MILYDMFFHCKDRSRACDLLANQFRAGTSRRGTDHQCKRQTIGYDNNENDNNENDTHA